MNKPKTRKSASRRFKITKTGKVMRRQASRRHLKASKSKKRLSNLKKKIEMKGYYAKKLRKAMGAKKIKVRKEVKPKAKK